MPECLVVATTPSFPVWLEELFQMKGFQGAKTSDSKKIRAYF